MRKYKLVCKFCGSASHSNINQWCDLALWKQLFVLLGWVDRKKYWKHDNEAINRLDRVTEISYKSGNIEAKIKKGDRELRSEYD